MGRYFQGENLITPQAAVFIDDTALAAPTLGGSGDLCILGAATGGKPLTALRFVTPQDAIATLRGGDLLRAVLRAFSVAPGFQGAPAVVAIRANAGTQATTTLVDAASKASIVLTSIDYGVYTNQIRVEVNAGTSLGRKITVQLGTGITVYDNVTRSGFSLAYIGANPTVTTVVGPVTKSATATTVAGAAVVGSGVAQSVQVASSTGFAIGNQLIAGDAATAGAEVVTITAIPDGTHITGIFANNHAIGDPLTLYTGQTGLAVTVKNGGGAIQAAESIVLPFDQFPTIQSVVDALNAKAGIFTATVLTQNAADPTRDQTYKAGLDLVTAGTSITPGAGSPRTYTMDLYACITAINSVQNPFVTAAAASGAGAPPAIEAANTWHYLAGGVDGNVPPSTSDWQSAFNIAATIDCSVITVATGDATVHAMLQTHVDFESSMTERHERIALVGGVAGETITQAQTRAGNLRDPRVGLVYPGIKDVDITQAIQNPLSAGPVTQTGTVITLDPWLVAAQLGGMFCGSPVQNSLTNTYLHAQGVEVSISNSDRENLLLSGIIPIQAVPNKGIRCVHSLSTWLADGNFRKVELSTMRASDFLAQTVRTACDSLIGQIVSKGLLLRIEQVVKSTLTDLEKQGIIVGDDAGGNPAFSNLQVSGQGDTVNVSFQAAIAIPANYILINASLVPFSGTVSG